MDPLSITASIIAVLQLTSEAIKYLVDIRNAPKECQSCTVEISNLLPLLLSLKSQAERAQDGDPWSEQLRRLNDPDGPLDQYKQTLELLLSKIDAGVGITKATKRLLWKFNKQEVIGLQHTIERLKSLIAVALSMDHMALSEAIKADTSSVRASLLHAQADISTLRTTAHSVQNDTKDIRNTTKTIRDAQSQEQYRAVLGWLSSTDYPAQQQDILSRRQDGTAQWFLDSTAFRQWMQGPEKTLFCPGIPGAGKTMMAAVAIDHLCRALAYDNTDIGIAYVFCSYKAQVDQSVSSLLAAVLKQLVLSSSDAMAHLIKLHEKQARNRGRPALDELLGVLLICVSRSTTYIIVDALDECLSRDQLVNILLKVQEQNDVRLLFTSRFIPDVTNRFLSDPQLEVRANDEDIKRFITGQTSRLPGCVQRDKFLKEDVQDKIAEAVDGMFLLARLYIDSVCAQTNPKKVRATLAQLRKGPEALNDAYKDALTRIDGQLSEHKALAQRALCWISYAKRQLTAHELRVALAIEPGESTLDVENLDDLDDIVSFCAGLITIDRESDIVRLVHYTTQDYLQRVRSTWAPDMQYQIAEACLSYLSFDEFRSGACTSNAALEARLSQYQFFDYSARFWSHHVRPVEQSLVQLARTVLYEEALLKSIIQVALSPSHEHRAYIRGCPSGFTVLHLIAYVGLHILLQQFLTHDFGNDKNNINGMDSDRNTPLYYASLNGHEQVVRLLLDKGADTNVQGRPDGHALQAAVRCGHEQIIRLLLDMGADVNAQGKHGTILHVASANGYEQTVRLLLDRGVDVSVQGGSYGNALQAASVYGYKQIVRLLLDRGADVNIQGGLYRNALQAAIGRGYEQIVRLLLGKGANVNVPGRYGTALQVASGRGYEQIVRLLLDKGAHVNTQGGYYGNALQAASIRGHEQIVKLLLDSGASWFPVETKGSLPQDSC